MQRRREPVPQLRSVRGEVEDHLLELLDDEAAGALVAGKGAGGQLLALARAGDDGPEEQVGHVDGDGVGEAGEFGGVGADDGGVAVCFERQDFEVADFLRREERCELKS